MAELATSMEVAVGGSVLLGEVQLPGHVQTIEVGGEVLFDEKRVPGRSGAFRQPKGFEDQEVTIRLRFLDRPEGESALEQAKSVHALFRSVDERARPQVFRLVNVITRACGIRDVVWRNWRLHGRAGSGGYEASLVFTENRPPIVKRERAASWKQAFAQQAGGELTTGATGGVAGAALSAGLSGAALAGVGELAEPYLRVEAARAAVVQRARTKLERVLRKVPHTDAFEERERAESAVERRKLEDDWRMTPGM